LLRCINRLNERYGDVRTTGRVTVFGRNIYEPDVSLGELRKTVGMVFQRPNPLPLSIYENVAFGLRVHSRSLNRRMLDDLVESALTDVMLWSQVRDDLHRKATSLTLEQQQKLCVARLLPLAPRIILMDEPCSALDAEGTAAIERLMGRLKDKYTVVIVTHNMAQARRASDECVFMLLGRMVEQGATPDMFLKPSEKQTELYIEGRYG
jgi:phosphate transport system ATP-binding protein